MALTRKFLQAMGIESDKIDEIIGAHRETVDALKDERDGYKEDADKLPNIQKELDEAKQRLAETEDADSKDRWKVKYDALKEEYDEYKSGVNAKETKQKKSDAYKDLLKETGVSEKRLAAVLRVTDLDGIEFGEDGKLKDVDKLKADIQKEWSDFITQESKKGAETKTPPDGEKGAEQHTPSRAAQVAQRRYDMMYGKKTEDTK